MHTKKLRKSSSARSRSARVASRARVPRRSTTTPSTSDGTELFLPEIFTACVSQCVDAWKGMYVKK